MAGTFSRSTEVLIIGGGPAGYVAAIRSGQLDRKVILVESEELGGECLNRGCIPSKALIHAALLYRSLTNEGALMGVTAPGARFDMAAAQEWKQSVVIKERQGLETLLRAAHVTVLKGEARLTGSRSATYTAADGGQERIDFAQAILATGARHVALPGFEPDRARVVNADQILSWSSLPRSVLVLGGGVSGCELGEFLSNVGVSVMIIELMPQILPGVDADLARELAQTLTSQGVAIHTGTRATALDRSGEGVQLTVEKDGKGSELKADVLFLTVGKRPATEGLGLDEVGVATDPKTHGIVVDDRQETSVKGIYAAGDVGRPPMLAHKAYREGVVAAEAAGGRTTRYAFQAMPTVVFTTPEIATVGCTVAEAEARGLHPRESRFPYAALGRAHANAATRGWVKLVGDSTSGRLLGVHAVGEGCGEFIAEVAHAIEMGSTVRDLALTIHPHPTYSELLGEAALLWLDEPMHVARRPGGSPRH